MKTPFIKSIYIKNFRSLQSVNILDCEQLNVFIGKNNSGKSTALAAIQLVFDHLKNGNIVAEWPALRWMDEHTHKDKFSSLQIGIEFESSLEAISSLCEHLLGIAPSLAKSVQQLAGESSTSIILRFAEKDGVVFQYIEHISFGKINNDNELKPIGAIIFSASLEAAAELFSKHKEIVSLENEISAVNKIVTNSPFPLEMMFGEKKGPVNAKFLLDRTSIKTLPRFAFELQKIIDSSESVDSFRSNLIERNAVSANKIETLRTIEISTPMVSYTGEIRHEPEYLIKFMRTYGAGPLIHLRERKQPIGREEANRLLQLKIRRGGPDKLQSLQQVVKSLLGVSLDAFQVEGEKDFAEMDVDDFLAEANGAGIREALRLILDLELNQAQIVLLEEPEVHLHPGLEFALHSYLQDKSKSMQIFLTTHSTNFIDTVSSQNIYLFIKDQFISKCERIGQGDVPTKIPSELGLRLSTVFMFDRLVFVEGPSDESVLREFGAKLGLDFAKASVAFIHMGGVKNFTHYAAEGTLDMLSRRNIKMWFLIDRDDRNDKDVEAMKLRLGAQATLEVLSRRDIENFLIDVDALTIFINRKLLENKFSRHDILKSLEKSAAETKTEVIRLRLENTALTPIYLRGRGVTGTVFDRIDQAISSLQARKDSSNILQNKIEAEVNDNWSLAKAIELAPGALILDSVCKNLGSTFKKESGDSAKLASYMLKENIDPKIANFLKAIIM